MNKWVWCVAFTTAVNAGMVSAQSWPDYHLTNGTHYASYGVEDYDPINPLKNLYIDTSATLQAGSTELDNIYDSNQVFLNGGTVYASAIDAYDFTWNSGDLHLSGGVHSRVYGLDSGTGKILNIDSGATVQEVFLSSLPSGNHLNLNNGGKLSVGDFNAAMDGFHFNSGGTLEVAGTMTGTVPIDDFRNLILRGAAASWNLGSSRLVLGTDVGGASVIVADGAQLTSGGYGSYPGYGNSVEVSGAGSQWLSSGRLSLGALGGNNNRLLVSNGGVVTSGSGVVGNGGFYSGSNVAEVSGEGSQWNMSGVLVVGTDWGSDNRLTISDGGVVNSAGGTIAAYRASNRNAVEVSGEGSQ